MKLRQNDIMALAYFHSVSQFTTKLTTNIQHHCYFATIHLQGHQITVLLSCQMHKNNAVYEKHLITHLMSIFNNQNDVGTCI